MTTHWLQAYLVESVQKNLCTKIYCTTCGAMDFRKGVVKAYARTTGVQPPDGMYRLDALAIARALAEVSPIDPSDRKLIDAGRCLLFDICGTVGTTETAQILGDSWGGNVLRRMREHDAARQAARRASAENETNARKQREEKKILKQQQHAKRLALKKERDQLWRERHGKPD